MEGVFPKGTGGFLAPQKVVEQFDLKPGMQAAHLGCGHGYFTIKMAEAVGKDGKIYAIDILDEALQTVKTQAKIHDLTNIDFIRANLELAGSSLLGDNSMDLALLANVLFQSQKKDALIKEAKRIVKENGKVIIIDWDPTKSKLGTHPDVDNESGQPASLCEALLAGWRLPAEEMKKIAEAEGLIFEKNLDVGDFHYGMVFRK